MRRPLTTCALLAVALLSCAEGRSATDVEASTLVDISALELDAPDPIPPDPFAPYLDDAIPVADGFGAPVLGKGWERCGDGCYARSRPANVLAIADGVVEPAADGTLRLRHRWMENQVLRELVSTWEGVSASLPVGARVRRGEVVGQSARVQLALDPPEDGVDTFLASRPTLPVPGREPVLALVSHDALELRVYHHSVEQGRYAISLGQQAGAKERRGDNRTPKGVYFVTQRSRGPFDGDYAAYYGGIWLRLNYPNAWDAARGVDQGLITAAEQLSISRAWRARATTLQKTRLGSGIGIHAWADEWLNEGPRHLSWGCLVVHPSDAELIYASLPAGSMVILF